MTIIVLIIPYLCNKHIYTVLGQYYANLYTIYLCTKLYSIPTITDEHFQQMYFNQNAMFFAWNKGGIFQVKHYYYIVSGIVYD